MPFWGSSPEGINYKIGVSDILRTWSSCLNYFKMTFIQMFKKLFLARWCLHGTFQFGCLQQKKRKHHSDDWYVNNDQRWCDLGFPKSIALKGRLHNRSNPLEVFTEQYHQVLFIELSSCHLSVTCCFQSLFSPKEIITELAIYIPHHGAECGADYQSMWSASNFRSFYPQS